MRPLAAVVPDYELDQDATILMPPGASSSDTWGQVDEEAGTPTYGQTIQVQAIDMTPAEVQRAGGDASERYYRLITRTRAKVGDLDETNQILLLKTQERLSIYRILETGYGGYDIVMARRLGARAQDLTP